MFPEDVFGGFFGIGIVFPLAFLAIVALAIVAVATGRAEPDPDGRRAYGFYLATIGVVAILVALFAVTDAAGNVIAALVEEDETFDTGFVDDEFFEETEFFEGEFTPPELIDEYDADDERYANAVRSGLLALAALTVYWFHRGRLGDVEEESKGRRGPAWRVHYGYLLAVSLAGVLVLLVAASDAFYGLFRAIAPGVTGFGLDDDVERRAGLTQLLRSGVLAAAAAAVLRVHWGRSPGHRHPAPARGARGTRGTRAPGQSPRWRGSRTCHPVELIARFSKKGQSSGQAKGTLRATSSRHRSTWSPVGRVRVE